MIIQMDSLTGKCWINFKMTSIVTDTLLEAIEICENINPSESELDAEFRYLGNQWEEK